MKLSLLKKIIGALGWMTAFSWAITPLYRPANQLPERHRSQTLITSIINKTKSHIKIAINATSTQGRSTIVRAANTLLRSGQQMPFEDFSTEALMQGCSFSFANKILEKLRLKGLITLVVTAGKDAQGKSIITIEETSERHHGLKAVASGAESSAITD